MSKKTEIPLDFDINEIIGNTSPEKPDITGKSDKRQDIIRQPDEVDEQALLESIANMNINDMIAKKREQARNTDDTQSTESGLSDKKTGQDEASSKTVASAKKTLSGKQRKASLQDYQQTFLSVPSITDRKTVFISNELRERIVGIVRRLGTEKSSVSGFIENLVIHHLEEYREDIESWKKL